MQSGPRLMLRSWFPPKCCRRHPYALPPVFCLGSQCWQHVSCLARSCVCVCVCVYECACACEWVCVGVYMYVVVCVKLRVRVVLFLFGGCDDLFVWLLILVLVVVQRSLRRMFHWEKVVSSIEWKNDDTSEIEIEKEEERDAANPDVGWGEMNGWIDELLGGHSRVIIESNTISRSKGRCDVVIGCSWCYYFGCCCVYVCRLRVMCLAWICPKLSPNIRVFRHQHQHQHQPHQSKKWNKKQTNAATSCRIRASNFERSESTSKRCDAGGALLGKQAKHQRAHNSNIGSAGSCLDARCTCRGKKKKKKQKAAEEDQTKKVGVMKNTHQEDNRPACVLLFPCWCTDVERRNRQRLKKHTTTTTTTTNNNNNKNKRGRDKKTAKQSSMPETNLNPNKRRRRKDKYPVNAQALWIGWSDAALHAYFF